MKHSMDVVFFLLCPDAEIDSSGAVEDLGVKLVLFWNFKLDFFPFCKIEIQQFFLLVSISHLTNIP